MNMSSMRDAFQKAGYKGGTSENMKNAKKHEETVDLTIDFKNDYDPVKEGEKLVVRMIELGKKDHFTTSQLRKIHSYASIVNNKLQIYESKCNSDSYRISEELQNDIQYIKLKLIYQMGREKTVKKWFGSEEVDGVIGIGLERIISDIGDSKEKFDRFYRLLESIIAYKKYLTRE